MYQYIDVSADTSMTVGGLRTIERRGVLLHTTEGFQSLKWLQGGSAVADRPASADYLVDRAGNVYQLTRVGRFAYHSGKARWLWIQDGNGTLNQSFLGIELEQYGAAGQKVTDAQYIASAALVHRLASYHSLDLRLLCGHYQAALPAGRKADPSGFDWHIWWRELLNPSAEGKRLQFPAVLP